MHLFFRDVILQKKIMIKIRIPLTVLNTFVTEIFDDDSTPENPGNSFPFNAVSFSLSTVPLSRLPDYNFSLYAHPSVNLGVMVPNDDLALVKSWLGNPTSAAGSPSETLVNRMTSAVVNAITKYFSDTSQRGFFTRPFKTGIAVRKKDGTFSSAGVPTVMTPSTVAPLMAIRESSLTGSGLQTVTEIINTPVRLQAHIKPFSLDLNDPESDSIVFLSSRQCDVLDGNERVSGIRSFEIFGEKTPCWNYNRAAEDLIMQNLNEDTSYRIIGEIPISDATAGIDAIDLPMISTNPEDWNSLPVFNGSPDCGRKPSRLAIETIPFDLGKPEEYKRVKGVTLRGIFSREISESGIKFTLYGSHHRERWHRIATVRGAHLRFLRTVSYRWYKVRIDAPYPSQLDAVTFTISNS